MDSIQYKCPNCGGELVFDPNTGAYSCPYCLSKFSQEDMDRVTAAKEAQAQQLQAQTAALSPKKPLTAEEEAARVYTCNSCGAEIMTDGTTAATFCFYCHSPIVLSGRVAGEEQPDYVIPFKIDKKRATEIFTDWVKQKKFVPKSFYSKESIEKMSGVYFPYMLYTTRIGGEVRATADKVRIYTTGNTEYTETSTFNVVRSGDMEVKHVMRNALKKADKVLAENVIPFEMEDLKPFNMSYLSGFYAEKRDLGREDYEEEVRNEIKEYAVQNLRNELSEYRNISITADNTKLLDEKWEYALFPVWTLTYKGNDGKIYYFSINGQTGKTIGELPVDSASLRIEFLKYFIPIAAVLFLLLKFLL